MDEEMSVLFNQKNVYKEDIFSHSFLHLKLQIANLNINFCKPFVERLGKN
jgi:hypothetical protein